MKVAFQTLGCRVNVYDSEAMIEMFKKDGYELVDFNEPADVYVINTCTVTNMGDKKSRQYISRAKRTNKDAVVAVVGCYSQVSKEDVMEIPGVDVILGSRNKSDIVFHVNRSKAEKKQIVEVTDKILLNSKFEDLGVTGYEGKTRAFLKIQDGCNRFCSYCIIPYARGGLSSKNPESVLKEIRKLAEEGFTEVILSGIHIASYGHDLPEKTDLLDLLEEIELIDGIKRVRIGSIEPMFFRNGRMDRIVKLKKLCPHFHLSLQSGARETLVRMNRRYTPLDFSEVVDEIRRRLPEASITTDVIVGFPGETKEEFNETYSFLDRMKLTKVHTFKYSPRKGTPAYHMEDQVDGNEKDRRSKLIMTQSDKNEDDFLKSYVGKTCEVLYEEGKNGVHMGYTANYMKVSVLSQENIQGRYLPTKITKVEKQVLMGEILA
ncbi:tRNA (N(6)-L-threonylcarbamoyladenosine(37)-C(2))-methylthiotransferase MtaB [Proteiniclasticum sp. SCR006]|uniref:Threonylcarbamoyladenosine tRNA methylthiotransferase MtaB n=1 Tax=Proteiniclasticum aestuarii TaxID=2817862 RepID=A0A939H684_9CLOT|nr:tRNA (N(6)-L-threonylcarbamoyladenosine(37)-C(2))-methylthiotransferase MtaB [Proteiniclasticum aestuarii]MBO1263871.1 tRNA (N(6)-L-threonylcarbamoyladenosine(37)-C(2))-methylthiotransferase MtaB [Proteiniclasticum aestuarii]